MANGKTSKKGVFFTLSIILILIPLVMLVSFYSTTSKTKMEDTNAKIRCDELHYFVEDVKKDLSRAGTIFGRRAAIYATDFVVSVPGNPLENYSFECSEMCNVDCQKIVYPRNGSEAAIAELALCGTLNGTNVTYMVNHTIKEWVKKIEMRSEEKNFMINMTIREVKVTAIDPWNFSITVDSEVGITDETSICYYQGTNFKTISNTSILGLEDPLYSLGSKGLIIKYMYDCDPTVNLSDVIGGGGTGDGIANGVPVTYSSIASLQDFCTNVSGDFLEGYILVMDQNGLTCSTQALKDCFDSNSTQHVGGVIIENGVTLSGCNVTIPYVEGSSTLSYNPDDCIYLKNNGSTHEIINGTNCQNLNYSCYQQSNNTYYCAAGECFNGPSFFDRLDGRYNLSERYINQSMEEYNNPIIGLETFIDTYDLVDHGMIPTWNASKIDYLYWTNYTGNATCEICSGSNPFFRLDEPHATKYDIDTGC